MFTPEQISEGFETDFLRSLQKEHRLTSAVLIFYINSILYEEMLSDAISLDFDKRKGNGFSVALNVASSKNSLLTGILSDTEDPDIFGAIEEHYFNYDWYIDIVTQKSSLGHWALMMQFHKVGTWGGFEDFDSESKYNGDISGNDFYKKKSKMLDVFKNRKKLADWGDDNFDFEEELNHYAFVEVAGDSDLKSKKEKVKKEKVKKEQKEEDDLFELEI